MTRWGTKHHDLSLADFRYGLRAMIKESHLSLIVVCHSGVWIGANTAIFSCWIAVLLKRFGLMSRTGCALWQRQSQGLTMDFPMAVPIFFLTPSYQEMRQHKEVFADVASLFESFPGTYMAGQTVTGTPTRAAQRAV